MTNAVARWSGIAFLFIAVAVAGDGLARYNYSFTESTRTAEKARAALRSNLYTAIDAAGCEPTGEVRYVDNKAYTFAFCPTENGRDYTVRRFEALR